MTKYCMRKAFKFIADRNKPEKYQDEQSLGRDMDNYLKNYF